MNKPFVNVLKKGVLLILLLSGSNLSADIVYPARLQLTETAPGIFDVFFVLPVIQGKIVKARAVFPEFCQSKSEPLLEIDAYQKKMRWQIGCGSNTIIGSEIGIEGLLGSQIDIILEISTLDGRTYKSTLSPARPYYKVPEAPGIGDLLKTGSMAGSRYVLLSWAALLMILVYFLTWKPASLGPPTLAIGVGLSLGYLLNWNEWILVPSWAGRSLSLLVSAALAWSFSSGKKALSGPTGVLLLGIGAVFIGTGFRKDEVLSGYTQIEELIFFGFVVIGFLTGALLLAGISRQLWKVLEIGLPRFRIPVARMVAGVATGFWLWELSLFWNVPATLPKLPLLLFALSLVLLLWQRLATRPFQLQILIACFVLGYFPGMLGYSWPHYWIILLGIQGLVLPFIIYKKRMGQIPDILLMCLAGFSAGGYLQNFAFENLSYPLARSVFYLLLLVGFAMVVKLLLETFIKPERSASLNKYGGLALLALCLFTGFLLLSQTYNHSISSLISSGFLPIPVVSVVFLFLAFFLWPRKRKIHKHLEVKYEPPVVSLGLLLLAVFLLPVHLKTKNPWYSLDAMDPEGIHTVVESKLLNTYTAFNIADEEILFERLNENLEEDLLDHIYLDSRRRLTMGLREGSTVTVREVDLAQLGEPLPDGSPEVGTQYPATWTVTAQVKHLKHIHYRKNKYTGTIALKSIDDVWKISEIILTSEDREVIASGNL